MTSEQKHKLRIAIELIETSGYQPRGLFTLVHTVE
jgi:hypothetical protein